MEIHHEPVPTTPPPGLSHDSADYEYAFTPTGAGYEHTDASVWIIVKFAIWLLVSAIVIHGGMWLMFELLVKQREATVEAQFPLAGTPTETRLPAGPRLQAKPANEIYEFRLSEDAILNNYGWVDRNAGTVRIPIAEAMRLTVERGVASRAAEGTETPGLMPADSSSGRTVVRRGQ
jgi:hypothetical protein